MKTALLWLGVGVIVGTVLTEMAHTVDGVGEWWVFAIGFACAVVVDSVLDLAARREQGR